jgi:enediyne biosynthesis protein E4
LAARSNPVPVQLAVAAVVVPLGLLARHPAPDPAEVDALAARFAFQAVPIPPPPEPEGGVTFAVNPSAPHLRTYFHSIGSGLALGDVDGDGLPNDLCLADIRTKALVIEPVPGTGARYAPFELDLGLPPGRMQSWPGVCRLVDLNEDGLTDVIVASMTALPVAYLRRDDGAPPGAAAFRRVPLVDGPDEVAYVPTVNVVDVDGDGHLDLVFGAYLPDGLRYYDPAATEPVQMQDSFTRARNGGRNRVLLWEGATSGPEPTVSFRDVPDPFPGDTARGWTLAIGSGDLDGDGLSDLYLANDFGPDTLLLNRSTPGQVDLRELVGRRHWRVPLSKTVGRDSFKGMGVDLADVDGDGLLDLYVSNVGSDFALNEGHQLWLATGEPGAFEAGVAPFRDVGEAVGISQTAWAWDARMDDFDNDGVVELVQATGFFKGTVDKWAELGQLGLINDVLIHFPGVWPAIPPETDIDGSDPQPFFVRGADGRFVDLSEQLFPGFLANARTVATADVDGDGDLDLAFGNHWEDSVLYRNDAPDPGAFLGLHVLHALAEAPTATHDGHPAPREGTPALGAAVSVTRADGRRLVRQVDASNGHTGARAPQLLFGLGDADPDTPVQAEIRWRDRTGRLRERAIALRPGWHTVVLGGAR